MWLGEIPFEGILGNQVFSSLVVELDWQRRVVRFHDPIALQAPTGFRTVAIETRSGHVVAPAAVVVGDRREERLNLAGFQFEGVVTNFGDVNSYIVPPGYAGGIGVEVLRRFVFILDLGSDKLLLKPTGAVSEPVD